MGAKEPKSFTIRWLDNCTYTLSPTAETAKKNKEMSVDKVLTIEILKISGNSCTLNVKSNFDDRTFTSEMIKLD